VTTATAPLSRQALGSLLRDAQADLADYGRLAALLERQFAGALRHEAAVLTALSEEITTLVDTLEQRRRQRVALVTQLLGAETVPSMAALFERLPAASRQPVETLWTELEEAVQDCKMRNARNARLMTEQQAILQRVLHGDEGGIYAEA
jgi:flagella synthesis protein FlgN